MTSIVTSPDRDSVPSSQFLAGLHAFSPLNIKLTCQYQHLASHSCTSCQTEKNTYSSLHLIAIPTRNFYQKLVFTHTATEKKNPSNKTQNESCYIPRVQHTRLSSSISWRKQKQLNSWLKKNDHAQCIRRWFLGICCTAFFFCQLKTIGRLNHLS